MKKLALLAALGLCAVSTQAATIQWAIGGTLYGVDKDGEATKAWTGTAKDTGYWSDGFLSNDPSFVLVYLGINASATTADKVTSDMIVGNTISAADKVVTTGSTSKMGKATKTTNYEADNVVGATYQVFFSYGGEIRDIFTDASLTTVAGVTTKLTQDPDTQIFSATPSPFYAAGASGTTAYVSTAPIPEPGTAAMALLGLGLLIRRRKA